MPFEFILAMFINNVIKQVVSNGILHFALIIMVVWFTFKIAHTVVKSVMQNIVPALTHEIIIPFVKYAAQHLLRFALYMFALTVTALRWMLNNDIDRTMLTVEANQYYGTKKGHDTES